MLNGSEKIHVVLVLLIGQSLRSAALDCHPVDRITLVRFDRFLVSVGPQHIVLLIVRHRMPKIGPPVISLDRSPSTNFHLVFIEFLSEFSQDASSVTIDR